MNNNKIVFKNEAGEETSYDIGVSKLTDILNHIVKVKRSFISKPVQFIQLFFNFFN